MSEEKKKTGKCKHSYENYSEWTPPTKHGSILTSSRYCLVEGCHGVQNKADFACQETEKASGELGNTEKAE